jgi:serine/threonine-protein kinase
MYHVVTGRPPFEADTPAAVMHKHLKAPLVPADHLNTALSAGVAEIIEVSMAKKREDRYASTQAMVEDLRAVRAGQAPVHARRAVSLDQLETLEATGKTVDIAPPAAAPAPPIWGQPMFLIAAAVAGVSIVVNLILIVILSLHGK